MKIRKTLGLDHYNHLKDELKNIKIGVIDLGFGDYKQGSSDLPSTAELITTYTDPETGSPIPGNDLKPITHGIYMAQIIWAITGHYETGPKFYLFNSNGIDNFRNAVKAAIDKKVDIILYSQNWELGGNFDGNGFINEIVNTATSNGIIWINSAGNYSNHVRNDDVSFEKTSQCYNFKNTYDKNQIQIVLSWNDFQNIEEYQTNKDLDLLVFKEEVDDDGKVVHTIAGKSELTQVQNSTQTERGELSKHARERLSVNLDRGNYCIKIVNQSKNFDASKDKIRITLISANKPNESIIFNSKSTNYEIMTPADNPNVITVGDVSEVSAVGPTVDGRKKPDVLMPFSQINFTDGAITAGTSNAAAMFAGITALMKAKLQTLNTKQIKSLIKSQKINDNKISQEIVSHVSGQILFALEQCGELQPNDFLGIDVEDERTILTIARDPLEFPKLFTPFKLFSEQNNKSSSDFNFYIAESQNQFQCPNVDTIAILRSRNQLPSFDVGIDGKKRWVELRYKEDAIDTKTIGRSKYPVWKHTPRPLSLIRLTNKK